MKKISCISYTTLFKIRRYQRPYKAGKRTWYHPILKGWWVWWRIYIYGFEFYQKTLFPLNVMGQISLEFLLIFYNRQWKVTFIQIMFGRDICEKYQSRDEKFPEPNGEGNLVSRLVFFANTPPKHDISV